jgi:hypothetical protein
MSIGYSKLATASGIGAGQTATMSIPTGLTYLALHIVAKNNGVAVTNWGTFFSEIRLSLDGVVKYRVTGNECAMLADYYGWNTEAGILPIPFARDYLRNANQESYLAWGTKGLESFTAEFDIAAGVVAPTMSVYATRGPGEPLGQHVEVNNQVFQVSSAGEIEFSDFPRVMGGLMALHIDTAAITDVATISDQVRLMELPVALARVIAEGKARWPRTWQTGQTHIDYHLRDRLEDIVATMVQDLRIRLTTTSGAIGARRMVFEKIVGNPPRSA